MKKKVEFPVNYERGDNYTHTHTTATPVLLLLLFLLPAGGRSSVFKMTRPRQTPPTQHCKLLHTSPGADTLVGSFSYIVTKKENKKQKTKEEFPKEESENKINNNRLLPSLLV